MRVTVNKIPHYFFQLEKYWFHGPQRRFARDAGVSASTLSRVLHGRVKRPHYVSICRIITHLEKELGYHLDPRDIFQVEE
jgi:transcriptional regulator with XRE-family HTH domain